MYLSNIKLWNFRKFGSLGDIDLEHPNLDLSFTPGLNVLIGENDSGKTAILEAIKMVMKTHAYERIVWEDDDFFDGMDEIRIELLIDGLTNSEAAHFTEWLGWNDSDPRRPILRLIYKVRRVNGRIIPQDLKAGMDETGSSMDSQAREYLKVTFLKPLRDAENELTAKKYSRLSQILEGHDLFKEGADGKDQFEGFVSDANDKIKEWFQKDEAEEGQKSNKEQIKDVIDVFLGSFVSPGAESTFSIAGSRIKEILEKLSLQLDGMTRPGLGTMNRLYMAAELLHLQKSGWSGIKLCLVEEEEAHLHPQAQMKVLETIQKQTGTQFIITTHSPNLASKVKLSEDDKNQVVVCKEGKVFPMGPNYTLLDKDDYEFLDHFLDVTKANLFFAKGIILVEGWAEEILIPALAKKMGKDLTEHEVSIVNVGSTAYMRYAKVFMRRNQERMGCKVAIITDLDVRPKDDGTFDNAKETEQLTNITDSINVANYPDIKWSIAKQWTLEWSLWKSGLLGGVFKKAAAAVHTRTFKNAGVVVDDAVFEQKLMDKLRGFKVNANGTHESVAKFDKVEVAYQMAIKLKNAPAIDFERVAADDFSKYLVDAINHVCS
jgi:putative ATP-dependent endonuclease of OLD family